MAILIGEQFQIIVKKDLASVGPLMPPMRKFCDHSEDTNNAMCRCMGYRRPDLGTRCPSLWLYSLTPQVNQTRSSSVSIEFKLCGQRHCKSREEATITNSVPAVTVRKPPKFEVGAPSRAVQPPSHDNHAANGMLRYLTSNHDEVQRSPTPTNSLPATIPSKHRDPHHNSTQ